MPNDDNNIQKFKNSMFSMFITDMYILLWNLKSISVNSISYYDKCKIHYIILYNNQ